MPWLSGRGTPESSALYFSPRNRRERIRQECNGPAVVPLNGRGIQIRDELGHLLVFLPCFMGLAATAAVRLERSLIQAWRAFCCGVTTAADMLWFLGLKDS